MSGTNSSGMLNARAANVKLRRQKTRNACSGGAPYKNTYSIRIPCDVVGNRVGNQSGMVNCKINKLGDLLPLRRARSRMIDMRVAIDIGRMWGSASHSLNVYIV